MSVDADLSPATLEALKALAEPVRWRIVEVLADEELCVCHLVDELDLPQPLVSHHLRALRDAGLVSSERHRYWTYYRLSSDRLRHVGDAIIELADSTPTPSSRRRPCC